MHGIASLTLVGDAGRYGATTRLIDLEQKAPLRLLFPREPACGVLQAVLLTTGGGMVGGDVYEVAVDAADAACAMVTTQAAEKVYRSTGADTRITVVLRVGNGGWLEWMPQETILFDGSRLDRRTIVDLDAGARFLGGEVVVFGRTAHGEGLTRGYLRDAWQIRIAGRLTWADTLRLEGDIAALRNRAAAFDKAVAAATLVYVADDAANHLEAVRAIVANLADNTKDSATSAMAASSLRLAVSCVNGLLVIRGLATDARLLRQAVLGCWSAMRALVGGLPRQLPRVWLV